MCSICTQVGNVPLNVLLRVLSVFTLCSSGRDVFCRRSCGMMELPIYTNNRWCWPNIILLQQTEWVFDPRLVTVYLALKSVWYLCQDVTLKPDVKSCIVHQFIRCKQGHRTNPCGARWGVTAAVLAFPSPATEKQLRENNAESIQSNNIHTLQWISGWRRGKV